ncbi:hypothetical protein EI200_11810 [Peribacillus simplex]|uniref:hypothetical protein n=1 Tax=Peribacillus simplex TaxID=1478 RepID=UPI000F642276|nr:hypothetical protein [Peribacillus simplex]RRN71134.1 hypothetical protein EI200_11810 [Peribacillus simplex]
MEDLIKRMDKLLNRFILESKKFVNYGAFPYGLMDLLRGDKRSNKLGDDFEYFTFTKSTKTLVSIRKLLTINNNEDVIILSRSIFENYLSCRYLVENNEKFDDFVSNPMGLALAHFNLDPQTGEIINREKKVIGVLENPNNFKLGDDKKYYYDFYAFLCLFTHCNFGVLECYVDKNSLFTVDKVNHAELSRLITLFTFTKLFETVVTVEGEDFKDKRTEKRCYQLVKDSIKLQQQVFDSIMANYQTDEGDEFYKFRNRRMRKMLKEMKKSLKEELGSVNKTDL